MNRRLLSHRPMSCRLLSCRPMSRRPLSWRHHLQLIPLAAVADCSVVAGCSDDESSL